MFVAISIRAVGQIDSIYQINKAFGKPKFTYNDAIPYISKNLKYPAKAILDKVQGKIFVSFMVNEDGHISDVTIKKCIQFVYDPVLNKTAETEVEKIGDGLDEEAIRVIRSMPPWKPAKQNGIPIKVFFTLPIVFKLS